MRSRRCLKIVSKRSDARKWIILVGLFLVTSVVPALEVRASSAETAFGVDVVFQVDGIDAERLVESLSDGHVAEFQYSVRLYRSSSGLAALFGDQLEIEHDETMTVRWDVFSRRYVAVVSGGDSEYFDSMADFLSRISAFRVTVPAVSLSDRHFLLARVEITPERIPPALRIVEVFYTGDRVVTPWVRVTTDSIRSD